MMTDDKKIDRAVRWRPSELAWGLAHADVHGLGDELEGRISSATDLVGDEDDDRETYIITATETKIWDAIVAVNGWIGDRPQGEYEADGFQKALAFAPRGPEGGAHDADEADED
jgi:hypothetical protein